MTPRGGDTNVTIIGIMTVGSEEDSKGDSKESESLLGGTVTSDSWQLSQSCFFTPSMK